MKHDSIDGLYMSAYPAFALLAALQLEAFSAFAAGPATAAEAAARLQVAPGRLELLLNALVAAGLLEKSGDRYSNGAEADRSLVPGRPGYLEGLGKLYLDRYQAALCAAQSIREDRPVAKKDFAAMTPAEAAAFFGGMHARAVNAGLDLARRIDFAGCATIVDAGGGSGGLAVGLCRVVPGLRATVADLASVLPIARQRIAASDCAGRIEVAEADFLAAPLAGAYDGAIVRAVLQVMSAADAARALANITAAVRPGGLVCVIGRVLDDCEISPEASVFFNLVFVSLYRDGRAYTESSYRGWLQACGVAEVRRIALAGGHSILWGRKRD